MDIITNLEQDNFSHRLKKSMEAKNVSTTELSVEAGVSYEMVRRYLNELAQQRKKTLEKIADYLDVSPSWLQFGSSNKLINNDIETNPKIKPIEKIFSIEMLEVSASAGTGYISSDVTKTINLIEYDYYKAKKIFNGISPLDIKIINVKGDSMQGTIESGDSIYVNVSVKAFDGDGIYVFSFGKGLYVKRLQLIKNALRVQSDNKNYDPWDIEEHELDQLHIHGKVLLSQSMDLRKHC